METKKVADYFSNYWPRRETNIERPTQWNALSTLESAAPRREIPVYENPWAILWNYLWGMVSSYLNWVWFSPIEPESFLLSNRLDPKIEENAYKILDIPPEKLGDLTFLNAQYIKIKNCLEERKEAVAVRYVKAIQTLLDDVETAYELLKKNWVKIEIE